MQRLDAIVRDLLAGVAERMAENAAGDAVRPPPAKAGRGANAPCTADKKAKAEAKAVAVAGKGRGCQSDGHCKRQTVRRGKG